MRIFVVATQPGLSNGSSTLAVRAVGGADDTCTVAGLPNRHYLPAAPGMILKNSCEGIKNLTRTQY